MEPKGIDLRMSGSMTGVLWRSLAYNQTHEPNLGKIKWEDVQIDTETWSAIVKCNFFNSFGQRYLKNNIITLDEFNYYRELKIQNYCFLD